MTERVWPKLLVVALGILPLTGCALLLWLPLLGGIGDFGNAGCTNQDVSVPTQSTNPRRFEGTYQLNDPAQQGPIAFDLSVTYVNAGRYNVSGDATFLGTAYSVDGEVLAGSCEQFVPTNVAQQSSPPPRELRTLALRLTAPSAQEAAYSVVAVGTLDSEPAYLASGSVQYTVPLSHTPDLGSNLIGRLSVRPMPY